MPDRNTDRLDAMMRKVRSLLARADHPETPVAEADSSRAMAEKIMRKYKIEESELIESGQLIMDVIAMDMPVYLIDSPWASTYMNIASMTIYHAGCQGVWSGWSTDPDTGLTYRNLQLFGYEADLRFADVLFQSARLTFADRMEPKLDASLSDMDNVYRMRNAGMERIKIAEVMGYGTTGSATAKVTRLYKKACEARGEDPTLTGRGMSVSAFREAYALGFVTELQNRMWRAKMAADSDGSGGLVLANREDKIREAMYQRYPSLRPDPNRTPAKVKPSRRRGWTAADQRREDRLNGAAGQAGRNAGKDAASTVDVGGVKPSRRIN